MENSNSFGMEQILFSLLKGVYCCYYKLILKNNFLFPTCTCYKCRWIFLSTQIYI
uniref:Uncharacterized protein n=1 Tax=Oryza brachyantha TaxID=4533 RepID=J3LA81_ORYBR